MELRNLLLLLLMSTADGARHVAKLSLFDPLETLTRSPVFSEMLVLCSEAVSSIGVHQLKNPECSS